MVVTALLFLVLPLLRPAVVSGSGRPWPAVVLLAVALPLAAIMLYLKLGTPQAIEANSSAVPPGMAAGRDAGDLSVMVDKLAAKMASNPGDGEGWALLARAYVELRRHKDALPAFEKASALLPNDPQLLADYADSLAMASERFDPKSVELVDRALKADPNNHKALLLAGTVAYDKGDYQSAIRHWEKVQGLLPSDSDLVRELAANIAEAKSLLGKQKPAS